MISRSIIFTIFLSYSLWPESVNQIIRFWKVAFIWRVLRKAFMNNLLLFQIILCILAILNYAFLIFIKMIFPKIIFLKIKISNIYILVRNFWWKTIFLSLTFFSFALLLLNSLVLLFLIFSLLLNQIHHLLLLQ